MNHLQWLRSLWQKRNLNFFLHKIVSAFLNTAKSLVSSWTCFCVVRNEIPLV